MHFFLMYSSKFNKTCFVININTNQLELSPSGSKLKPASFIFIALHVLYVPGKLDDSHDNSHDVNRTVVEARIGQKGKTGSELLGV